MGDYDMAEHIVFKKPPGPLPYGPEGLAATFDWVQDSLSSLTDEQRLNFRQTCDALRVSSHCSGMGCLEQILEKLGCSQSDTACAQRYTGTAAHCHTYRTGCTRTHT